MERLICATTSFGAPQYLRLLRPVTSADDRSVFLSAIYVRTIS
eukprot:gene1448-5693_t